MRYPLPYSAFFAICGIFGRMIHAVIRQFHVEVSYSLVFDLAAHSNAHELSVDQTSILILEVAI